MRILVASDTHGDEYALRNAVMQQPTAEVVLFCGDGEEDFMRVKASFPDKMMLGVRGNCDWGSRLPTLQTPSFCGVRIFLTHGHLYGAKMGLYNLYEAARGAQARIVAFGHTHEPLQDYDGGLYAINPGSLSGYVATYGIIDLTPAGIVTNVMRLR